MITYEEALKITLSNLNPTSKSEYVSLLDALGRVCAQDVTCRKNLPSYNNAALDGFAIAYKDVGKTLKIKTTVFAGDVVDACLEEGECYKIMTGACVPSDADTIVAFEDTLGYDEYSVKIPENVKKANAFRFKGEEQTKGNSLMKKGELLTPAHIAMLSAQGIMQVNVHVKPKIAVVSTGNELKEPWEEASEETIFNANAFAIISILKRFGFEATYSGVIPDSLDESTSFLSGLKSYDFIISSGGVSKGEADFVRLALEKNGFESKFHGVNLKPGRAMMVGTMNSTMVISLPGNPMAAFLNAYTFVIPAVKAWCGYENPLHKTYMATNTKDIYLKSGRNNLILGTLKDGNFTVTRDNKFGSGMLTPLMESNALLISDTDTKEFKVNEKINVVIL